MGPAKKNDAESLSLVKSFLENFPGVDVIPVSRPVAQEAAKLRAGSRLPLPDALIIATAKVSGCEAIVANDLTWAKADVLPVILLDDYCDE
ncbi:MAG: PIN domain-containing protein [Bacillota bacterium]